MLGTIGFIGFIGFLLGFLKGAFAWLAWWIRVTKGYGVKAEFGATAGNVSLTSRPRNWLQRHIIAHIPHPMSTNLMTPLALGFWSPICSSEVKTDRPRLDQCKSDPGPHRSTPRKRSQERMAFLAQHDTASESHQSNLSIPGTRRRPTLLVRVVSAKGLPAVVLFAWAWIR
jgi:hypothetical protein